MQADLAPHKGDIRTQAAARHAPAIFNRVPFLLYGFPKLIGLVVEEVFGLEIGLINSDVIIKTPPGLSVCQNPGAAYNDKSLAHGHHWFMVYVMQKRVGIRNACYKSIDYPF